MEGKRDGKAEPTWGGKRRGKAGERESMNGEQQVKATSSREVKQPENLDEFLFLSSEVVKRRRMRYSGRGQGLQTERSC